MSSNTSLLDFARLCEALEGTRKRKEKKHLISVFLLKLEEDEVQPAISFLIGRFSPRQIRVLWRQVTKFSPTQ